MFVLSFSEPEGGVVLVRRHFHESRLVCDFQEKTGWIPIREAIYSHAPKGAC
jgi:hypothetical protein